VDERERHRAPLRPAKQSSAREPTTLACIVQPDSERRIERTVAFVEEQRTRPGLLLVAPCERLVIKSRRPITLVKR